MELLYFSLKEYFEKIGDPVFDPLPVTQLKSLNVMARFIEVVLAGMLVCLAGILLLWKKSRGPNPEEKDTEDDESFDEKVHYMKDHEYVWRKPKVKP